MNRSSADAAGIAELPVANAEQSTKTGADNATTAPPPDDYEYPDGGFRAWSQVVAANLLNMLCWGMAISFGVSQLHYTESLGLPSSQVSWIGSVQLFLTFGICAISGRLTDAGYARATSSAGCFIAVLGLFMASIAKEYWQIFMSQGVCLGVGLGLMFMPAVSIVNSYFKRRRSFALTLAAMGAGTGGLVFPSTIQFLTPQIGFPWAMRCAGFVALVIAVIANLLLRPRLSPRKTGPLIEWTAFRELPYVLFLLGGFLYFYALYFSFFYINSYARNEIGFSNVDSVHLLLLNNAVGLPARPTAGYIADRWLGPINLFAGFTGLFGIMIFAWSGVSTRTDMYIFSAFLGLVVGAGQGIFVGSLASLTKDPQKMGTRFGMVLTLCAFATLAGPPTAGAIIDRSGGKYIWAQVWGGSLLLCATLILLGSRVSVSGWKWKAKL